MATWGARLLRRSPNGWGMDGEARFCRAALPHVPGSSNRQDATL